MYRTGESSLINLLRNVSLFKSLTDEQLNHIAQYCARVTVKTNTVLFREKEIGDEFYILLAGSVKIYTTGANREEKILSVFRPGDSFGELALIDGKPRSATAETLQESVLFSLSKQNFLGIMAAKFDITLSIMQELCQRLRDTNQHVHDLTFLDSRTRILKHLIQMSSKHGVRNGSLITLRIVINYDELSLMAGVSKDVLMQVLRELQDKGVMHIKEDEFTLDIAKIRS
jgi:CRP/FNR family cyclic AMP-dependent transcriptional regulator